MNEPRSVTPVTVGDIEIEPIEKTIVRVENVCGVTVVVAVKEPVAVVLRSPRGTWRVDLASLEVMSDPAATSGAAGATPR